MRYILVPPPIAILNTITDEPNGETFSFARSCRLAIQSLAMKGQTDATTMHDLKRKTDAAVVGQYLSINEDEWKLLDGEFKRPDAKAGFSPLWTLSAESHQSAVRNAVDKLPTALVNSKPDEAAS